jgi:4'-phosphopantetheinyl transferase
MIRRLARDEVSVWYWPTADLDAATIEGIEQVLSQDERGRRDRFRFARGRRDFSAAHTLLRHVLSLYGQCGPEDWQFSFSAQGKPFIVAEQAGTPPLAFNLSHTDGLVACAVSSARLVGVDVEGITRQPADSSLATRYFAASEIDLLHATAPDNYAPMFIELWTLKESYIKALGTGLGHPLDSFAFSFDTHTGLRFSTSAGHSTGVMWQFALMAPSPNHRMALAIGADMSTSRVTVTVHAVGNTGGVPMIALRWSTCLDVRLARRKRRLLKGTYLKRSGRAQK